MGLLAEEVSTTQLAAILGGLSAILALVATGLGTVLGWRKLTKLPPVGEQFVTHAEMKEVVGDLRTEWQSDLDFLRRTMEAGQAAIVTMVRDSTGTINAVMAKHSEYVHERNHSMADSLQRLENQIQELIRRARGT